MGQRGGFACGNLSSADLEDCRGRGLWGIFLGLGFFHSIFTCTILNLLCSINIGGGGGLIKFDGLYPPPPPLEPLLHIST